MQKEGGESEGLEGSRDRTEGNTDMFKWLSAVSWAQFRQLTVFYPVSVWDQLIELVNSADLFDCVLMLV